MNAKHDLKVCFQVSMESINFLKLCKYTYICAAAATAIDPYLPVYFCMSTIHKHTRSSKLHEVPVQNCENVDINCGCCCCWTIFPSIAFSHSHQLCFHSRPIDPFVNPSSLNSFFRGSPYWMVVATARAAHFISLKHFIP